MGSWRNLRVASLGLFLFLVSQTHTAADGTGANVTQPAAPPAGVDLDVTYISREPRYRWTAEKQWPDPGEVATFTAHIASKGTVESGPFEFVWSMDDEVVATGTASSLLPQGQATQVWTWPWQAGRHNVRFQADPQNLISETAETNNSLSDATDALSIGFWVEEAVYQEWNNLQNGAGTYSWEDWAQRILQKLNWMFERSVYPLAPLGVLTRVRLDNVIRAPDFTLFNAGPGHAPEDNLYDGRWGFSYEEYHNCQCCASWICYDVPWWVIHELGHYLLGRVDLYALDVQDVDVNVLDENGRRITGTPLLPNINADVVHYTNYVYDVMHVPDPYSLFSDYHAYSLNRDWPQGQRTHRGWSYIYDLPADTQIRVLDDNGHVLPNVQVSVYQAVPGNGASGPYSQNLDNQPDIVGVTDGRGRLSLGSRPFGPLESYGITAGIALLKLKDLASGQYRYVWLEVKELNLAYWRGQRGVYVHDVRFPMGPKRLRVSANSVAFSALSGTDPSPQNLQVEVLGEAVGYWSVERCGVPWLRTIPSPDVAISYLAYPPGPLTLIVESAGLSVRTYTTTVTVSAAGAADSPQTVMVRLDVIAEAEYAYLPMLVR